MLGKLVLSTCFHSSRNASLEHSASPFQAVSHSVPLDEAEDPTLDNRWFSWPELEREEQRARDKCHKAMRKARKAAQAGAVLEMTPVIVASTLDSRAWAISASIVITLFKSSWFTDLTAFAHFHALLPFPRLRRQVLVKGCNACGKRSATCPSGVAIK